MKQKAAQAGVPFSVDSVGGMFGFYFSKEVPKTYADVTASDIEAFKKFFHLMLDRGVYLAPSAYEAGFISIAHDDAVLAEMLKATEESFQAMV